MREGERVANDDALDAVDRGGGGVKRGLTEGADTEQSRYRRSINQSSRPVREEEWY